MANDLISARLVWDGGDEVYIPPEMGTPREDQMRGLPAERLSELAGRVCYDSLGKGRPSFTVHADPPGDKPSDRPLLPETIEGYHDHILKVGHFSVLEHFYATFSLLGMSLLDVAAVCVNRPGVFLSYADRRPRITLNLRAVLEFEKFAEVSFKDAIECYLLKVTDLCYSVRHAMHVYAPRIVPHPGIKGPVDVVPTRPLFDEERWISLFVSGSRGLSHELVRHGDFTAISQRSTRFVDESESDWVEHPLIEEYKRHHWKEQANRCFEPDCEQAAKQSYRQTVHTLENWLLSRGLDKTSARKQARGAARGYLGNALYTELIFSASVLQWKRMLRQRASPFADAEIRELFCKVLPELKRSRYGDCFDEFSLVPAHDGIGSVAVEG